MRIFSDAQGQLTPLSMVISGGIVNSSETFKFMVVLVTCINGEDPVKNDGARVFTTLYMYIYLSDAQGQITPLLF